MRRVRRSVVARETLSVRTLITLAIAICEERVHRDRDAHDHTKLAPVWLGVAVVEGSADANGADGRKRFQARAHFVHFNRVGERHGGDEMLYTPTGPSPAKEPLGSAVQAAS